MALSALLSLLLEASTEILVDKLCGQASKQVAAFNGRRFRELVPVGSRYGQSSAEGARYAHANRLRRNHEADHPGFGS